VEIETDVLGFVPSAIRKSLFQSSSRREDQKRGEVKMYLVELCRM
jgi:hypothetical protein